MRLAIPPRRRASSGAAACEGPVIARGADPAATATLPGEDDPVVFDSVFDPVEEGATIPATCFRSVRFASARIERKVNRY